MNVILSINNFAGLLLLHATHKAYQWQRRDFDFFLPTSRSYGTMVSFHISFFVEMMVVQIERILILEYRTPAFGTNRLTDDQLLQEARFTFLHDKFLGVIIAAPKLPGGSALLGDLHIQFSFPATAGLGIIYQLCYCRCCKSTH
jgi:hypothetical protein